MLDTTSHSAVPEAWRDSSGTLEDNWVLDESGRSYSLPNLELKYWLHDEKFGRSARSYRYGGKGCCRLVLRLSQEVPDQPDASGEMEFQKTVRVEPPSKGS